MSNDTTLELPNDKKHHLLVIRLSAMGDVAMTVPVLIALTSTYPQLKLTILTKPFFAPILNQIPNVTVHKVDVKEKHKGFIGLWKLYKELKSSRIEGVADLHNVLRSSILKQYFRLQSVPFLQVNKARKEKKALIAVTDKVFKPLRPMHLRYADVFADLGFPLELNKDDVLPKRDIPSTFKEQIANQNKPSIGIAPFAAFKGKTYPLDFMKAVVRQLNELGTHQIFLFGGGPVEKQALESWEKEFQECICVAGKINFTEELALISNLSLMVAMDSGNAHLAAMFGIPTITLWGVTHPHAGFYPFGQDLGSALLADREKYPLIPTSIYGNKFPERGHHAKSHPSTNPTNAHRH
jgi:ADP-heptose:LPS heptosyltransferase